jgi:hypothetical protein
MAAIIRRTATSLDHDDNPQGLVIWCVGDEVFTNQNGDEPIGCVRMFFSDVGTNIVEIGKRFQVKRVAAAYALLWRWISVLAFKREKASSPSMGCTRPDFRSS